MNCYEHTLITKQDLQENDAKKLINKYEDIINKNSGNVLKVEQWGLKKFSHKIKNNKRGFYFHIKFKGIGKTIEELEKVENIDQMLIRFLTVRVKKHDLKKEYFEKSEYRYRYTNMISVVCSHHDGISCILSDRFEMR